METTGKSVVCTICGETVSSDRKSLRHHIKSHGLSGVELERMFVYSLYGRDDVENVVRRYCDGEFPFYKLPLNIGQYISSLGLKRSSSEERHTSRYVKGYAESISKKYGDGITNISQAKAVKDAKMKSLSKTYGSYDKYVADRVKRMAIGYRDYSSDSTKKDATYDKIRNVMIGKYGCENPSQIQSSRESISRKAKDRFSRMSDDELRHATRKARASIPHSWNKTTKIEGYVAEALTSNGIDIVMHKRFGKYSADIVIEDRKIVIEVQGDIYHANPKMFRCSDVVPCGGKRADEVWERDSKKRMAIEDAGYNVIYLWESDIRRNRKNMFEFVVSEIGRKIAA